LLRAFFAARRNKGRRSNENNGPAEEK